MFSVFTPNNACWQQMLRKALIIKIKIEILKIALELNPSNQDR